MKSPNPTMPANHQVSPIQFAKALARQKALTDQEWLRRCDELAVEQRVLFLELLTFGRDGLPAPQLKSLIDYLSVLQSISAEISKPASAPVLLPEFQAAVKRAMIFFHALTTDDRAHFDRMVIAWHDSSVTQTEPVIWAGCIETLREPEILAHPLFKDIGVKPLNEAQLRELIPVRGEKRVDAWKRAVELAGDKPITAKIVRKAAEKFRPRKSGKARVKKVAADVDLGPALKLLASVEKVAEKGGDVVKELKALRELLEGLAGE